MKAHLIDQKINENNLIVYYWGASYYKEYIEI